MTDSGVAMRPSASSAVCLSEGTCSVVMGTMASTASPRAEAPERPQRLEANLGDVVAQLKEQGL